MDAHQQRFIFQDVPYDISNPEAIEIFLQHCRKEDQNWLLTRYQQERAIPSYQYRFTPDVLPETLKRYLDEPHRPRTRGRSTERSNDRQYKQGRDTSRSYSRCSKAGEGHKADTPTDLFMRALDMDTASTASDALQEELSICKLTKDCPCLACKGVHEPYQCPHFQKLGWSDEKIQVCFKAMAQHARDKARASQSNPTQDFQKGGQTP